MTDGSRGDGEIEKLSLIRGAGMTGLRRWNAQKNILRSRER